MSGRRRPVGLVAVLRKKFSRSSQACPGRRDKVNVTMERGEHVHARKSTSKSDESGRAGGLIRPRRPAAAPHGRQVAPMATAWISLLQLSFGGCSTGFRLANRPSSDFGPNHIGQSSAGESETSETPRIAVDAPVRP